MSCLQVVFAGLVDLGHARRPGPEVGRRIRTWQCRVLPGHGYVGCCVVQSRLATPQRQPKRRERRMPYLQQGIRYLNSRSGNGLTRHGVSDCVAPAAHMTRSQSNNNTFMTTTTKGGNTEATVLFVGKTNPPDLREDQGSVHQITA